MSTNKNKSKYDPNLSIGKSVINQIDELANRDTIIKKWEGSAYGKIQRITNPNKGVLGEMLVANWLDDLGYLSEEKGYDRQLGGNNCDILVLINDQIERVEVKLATQDVNYKYQFNWIPIKNDIAFIVFLAIDPDSIYISVKSRNTILNYIKNPKRGRTLTPVPSRESKTHVKWTASKENADLKEVKTLGDVANLFKKAMDDYIKEKK